MKRWPVQPQSSEIAARVSKAATHCLPAALLALALVWPMHRQIRLWEPGPTGISAGLERGVFIYFGDIPALAAFLLRAYGLTPHSNILGGVSALATWLGIGLILDSRGPSLTVALGLTALSFTGMLLSFSRSAWAGLGVAGLIAAVILTCMARHRREIPWRKLGLILSALLICSLAFALTQWRLLQPRLGLTTEGVEIRSLEEMWILLGMLAGTLYVNQERTRVERVLR